MKLALEIKKNMMLTRLAGPTEAGLWRTGFLCSHLIRSREFYE